MEKPSIMTRANGPYLVKGPVRLIDADGKEYTLSSETIALCRCGHSANKPFCDGTHSRIGLPGEREGSLTTARPSGWLRRPCTAIRHRVADDAEAIELCFARGWTDGLPVVPPTPDRVGAHARGGRGSTRPTRSPTSLTARCPSPPRRSPSTPSWRGAGPSTCRSSSRPSRASGTRGGATTGPAPRRRAPPSSSIVNGPVARELDINAGDNLFGPGWRANLTIGRAVRLVMRNVCGSMPAASTGDARPSRQAVLRDRRERGREPLDAAPRRSAASARTRAR